MANRYQQTVSKWMRLGSQAQAAGVPTAVWKPIAARDVQSVLQGGSPLAEQEAIDMVRAAHTGQAQVQKEAPHGILDLPSNALKDLQGIIMGLPKALVNIANPSTYTRSYRALTDPAYAASKGYEKWGSPAADVRNLAHLPALGLVPGIHDVAGLTSAAGRRHLMEHPVGATLDVLPYAGAVGKAAMAGRLAEGAVEAGSAAEALSAGNPLKAGFRALGGKSEVAPGTVIEGKATQAAQMMPRTSQIASKMAQALHIDIMKRAVGGASSIGNRVGQKALHDTYTNEIAPLFNGLDEAELKRFTEPGFLEHANPLDPALSPRLSSVIQKARQFEASMVEHQMSEDFRNVIETVNGKASMAHSHPGFYVPFETGPGWMPYDSKLAGAWNKVIDRADKVTNASAALRELKASDATPAALQAAERDLARAQINHSTAFAKQMVESLPRIRPSAVRRAEEQLRVAQETGKGVEAAQRRLGKVQEMADRVSKTKDLYKMSDRRRKAGGALEQFTKARSKDPMSPELQPAMNESYKTVIEDGIRAKYAAAGFAEAWKVYEEARSPTDLRQIFEPKELRRMEADAQKMVFDMVKQGMDPAYLHRMDPIRALEPRTSPTIRAGRIARQASTRERQLTIGTTLSPTQIGLTEGARQLASTEGELHLIENGLVKPGHVVPRETALDQMRTYVRNTGAVPVGDKTALDLAVETLMRKQYSPFDPHAYFGGGEFRLGAKGDYVIPKAMHEGLMDLGRNKRVTAPGVWDKARNVWVTSTIFGPRHIAHVGFGGLFMTLLKEPQALAKVIDGYHWYKSGDFPVEIGTELNVLTNEDIMAKVGGQTAGRLLWESLSKAKDKVDAFERAVANSYKGAIVLDQLGKGASMEEAVNLMGKVLIDMDKLAPIERTIIKRWFPFYGFTRHVFKYLGTMPIDHPWRTSVLSNFAEQEWADNKSGLPMMLENLLFFGHKDSSGAQNAIDLRTFNPFRSAANDFSINGFLAGLNPAVQMVMLKMGVNTLSGTPELYPHLHIDPVSGSLVADPVDHLGLKMLETWIPETTAIDQTLAISDRYRYLSKSDPAAARRNLFSVLNIPFVGTLGAGKRNIGLEIAKAEQRRYRLAQTDVSQAVNKGGTDAVRRYSLVPSPSYLGGGVVPGGALADIIDKMHALSPPGVSPRAVMETSTAGRKKRKSTKPKRKHKSILTIGGYRIG